MLSIFIFFIKEIIRLFMKMNFHKNENTLNVIKKIHRFIFKIHCILFVTYAWIKKWYYIFLTIAEISALLYQFSADEFGENGKSGKIIPIYSSDINISLYLKMLKKASRSQSIKRINIIFWIFIISFIIIMLIFIFFIDRLSRKTTMILIYMITHVIDILKYFIQRDLYNIIIQS